MIADNIGSSREKVARRTIAKMSGDRDGAIVQCDDLTLWRLHQVWLDIGDDSVWKWERLPPIPGDHDE